MKLEYNILEIDKAAKQLLDSGKQYKIWALHGEMGAGKTTLVHAVCKLLGVKDVISSPTYALINEYASPAAEVIYHMDWYRLKDEEEAIEAGVEDCLISGNFCIIEWPEKANGLLADNVLNIYIENTGENKRSLRTEKQG